MKRYIIQIVLILFIGCDNSNTGSDGTSTGGSTATTGTTTSSESYVLTLTVTNLTETLKIKNSSTSEMLTITTNGTYSFPTKLPSGTSYSLVVESEPAGYNCQSNSSSGTITADVTITYNCRLRIDFLTFGDANFRDCMYAYGKTYTDEITEISCNAAIANLNGAQHFTEVTSIWILGSSYSTLSDVQPLGALTKATILVLGTSQNIANANAFANLTELTQFRVYLASTRTMDSVDFLSSLTKLTFLALTGVSNLNHATMDAKLAIAGTRTKLTALSLNDTGMTDAAYLTSYTGLFYLDVSRNPFTNWNQLKALTWVVNSMQVGGDALGVPNITCTEVAAITAAIAGTAVAPSGCIP